MGQIKGKASLGNLGKTCKAFHSLVMPRLYKRVEGSVIYHAHIAKLIRRIEPALTIEQRKQLRKEGQYKGQQETFPNNVDGKRKPEIAKFIQQAAFEIGDPGKKHKFIVYRYIEELLESASNLQVLAVTDFTEYEYQYLPNLIIVANERIDEWRRALLPIITFGLYTSRSLVKERQMQYY